MRFLNHLLCVLISLGGLGCSTSSPEKPPSPEVLSEGARAVLDTIRPIDSYPSYTMRYPVDYRLGEVLERGLASEAEIQAYVARLFDISLDRAATLLPQGKRCTGFSAGSLSGDRYQGHNEDWTKGDYLVLFTSPSGGIPSVSLVDVRFAAGISQKDRRGFLMAPFLALSGMNRSGLAVATYSVPACRPPETPAKRRLLWSVVIRMLLDRAHTLDEALALIDSVNVVIEPQNDLQFFIGDAQGHSAVVAWVDGKTTVVRKQGPWQAVTNFVQFNATEADFSGCARYQTAKGLLVASGGLVTDDSGMEILKQTAQPGYTQFSVLYNLSRATLRLSFGRNYGKSYDFSCESLLQRDGTRRGSTPQGRPKCGRTGAPALTGSTNCPVAGS